MGYCPWGHKDSDMTECTSHTHTHTYTHTKHTHAKWLQSCPTLCNPMDCSLPISSVHGILQARIPEWVAIPSSRDLPDPGIKLPSLAL